MNERENMVPKAKVDPLFISERACSLVRLGQGFDGGYLVDEEKEQIKRR